MRHFNITPFRPAARPLVVFALVLAAAIGAACSGPSRTPAVYTNAAQAVTLHALSGTPTYLASALSIPGKTTTKVDGSFSFDVAFDINAAGQIVYLPPHMVGENPVGNRRVGIMLATTSFDNVSEAPLSGYVYDSVTVARVGQAVIVQTTASTCSIYALPYLYAKIVIDSIEPVTRTLWGRTTINQNCTFRSLADGLPTF